VQQEVGAFEVLVDHAFLMHVIQSCHGLPHSGGYPDLRDFFAELKMGSASLYSGDQLPSSTVIHDNAHDTVVFIPRKNAKDVGVVHGL